MKPIDPLTIMAACVNTMLQFFIILAAFQSTTPPVHSFLPPIDILEQIIEQTADLYNVKCLKRPAVDEGLVPKKKRKMVNYDRPRAYACVMSDWMSPMPRFDDKQFERTFRIKRGMVDSIIGNLAKYDHFWTTTIDATWRPSISPVVKFLAAQKLICYGVSFSAFQDYFQMGESTAKWCVSKLARGIYECPEIADIYLRNPTKREAKRIVEMHKRVHGVVGMLGSLDVTKIVWKNCPKALQGQYKGKEKVATIGLEVVADFHVWIWHCAFGFPGSLNDINIWERSPLFQSMQDGSHSKIDIPFHADGKRFDKLFYLVDGIYPAMTRFLATISDPSSRIATYFATKQEAWRKDVERAFGVLKIKFLCLQHPVQYHYTDDIFYVAMACVAMHNMMVKARVKAGEEESPSFYEISDEDRFALFGVDSGSCDEHDNSDDNDDIYEYDEKDYDDWKNKTAIVQKRWRELYDSKGAKELQVAIMNQLFKDKFGDNEFETSAHEMTKDYDPLHI